MGKMVDAATPTPVTRRTCHRVQPVPAETMVEAAGEHVREALAVHRCDERPTFEELPRSR